MPIECGSSSTFHFDSVSCSNWSNELELFEDEFSFLKLFELFDSGTDAIVSGTGFIGTGGENRFEWVECDDGGDGDTIRTCILELFVWVELFVELLSSEISTELGMSFDSGVKLFLRILGFGGCFGGWSEAREELASDRTRL